MYSVLKPPDYLFQPFYDYNLQSRRYLQERTAHFKWDFLSGLTVCGPDLSPVSERLLNSRHKNQKVAEAESVQS